MSDTNEKPQAVKINKWDGSAVKNALDDAVKEVLTSKPHYEESNALMNGRLVLCTIAVAVAMFAVLWDYLYPFPASKPVLIMCVSSYFALMGLIMLYNTYKEKGIFVTVVQKDSSGNNQVGVWEASSLLKKYDDNYNLSLAYTDAKTKASRETTIVRSVANFIDVNGVVVTKPLELEVNRMHQSLLKERKDK